MQTHEQDQHVTTSIAEQPELPPGWQPGIPLLRLFTCGRLRIDLLQAVPDGDASQAHYVELPPQRLQGRGPGPALTVLKLLISQPERAASKDWLMTHLRQDEQEVTRRRMENIVSSLRGLLCLPSGQRIPDVLLYVRASAESGDGYRVADYPLVWLDTDALAWQVKRACLLERFQDDAFPHWQRAYQLASRGTYLLEESYSDWAQPQRERVEGYLRQSVHALSRLLLARSGEAGEEEVIRLLRDYWLGHPADEDALWPLLDLLGKHGCYQEALQDYERLCETLEEQGLTKGGRKREPDQRTRELVEYLRVKHRRSLRAQPVVVLPAQTDQQAQAIVPVQPLQPSLAQMSGTVVQQVLHALLPFQHGLPLPGDLSAEADLALPGVWVARGAGQLGQLFEAGWSSEMVLDALQNVLQVVQAMPAARRHQLLELGTSAFLSEIPTLPERRITEEKRLQFTCALGKSIGNAWTLFHTMGTTLVLAVAQAQLYLVQQNHAIIYPTSRGLFYSAVYNLIGSGLLFQGHHEAAQQAHEKAYIAALERADVWNMAQSLNWQSIVWSAGGKPVEAIQAIEAALRLLVNQEDEAQLRLRSHLLAKWAENAAMNHEDILAEEKIAEAAAFLDRIDPNEEFDKARWHQIAGDCALTSGNYTTAIDHFQQALAQLPQEWLVRRIMTLIPLARTYASSRERDASIAIAEEAIPVVRSINAPVVNKQFMEYLQSDLLASFPYDERVLFFIKDVLHQLPHLETIAIRR